MEYKSLKELTKITMGQSPDSSSYNEAGEGMPFYQGNADFGEVYPTPRVWCNAPKKIAHAGDILISVRAPIGALNYANEECCIGRGLAAITIDDPANRSYIFHLLKARNEELNRQGTGSTFKAISRKVLETVQVPMIGEEERENSMKLMDVLESVIKDRKRQLVAFDELVKARFVEMFGGSQDLDKWKCCHINEIAKVTVGVVVKPTRFYTDDAQEGVKAFRSLNIREMEINDKDWVYFTKDGNAQNKKSQLCEGDVLIVRSGYPGTSCVVTSQYEGCNAIDIIIARPDKKRINPYYLCAFNNLPHGMNQIQNNVGGAAQQHFNVGRYNMMKIALPPMDMQDDFMRFFLKVEQSKVALKRSLQETQILFDSLMQQYFS